MLQLTPTDQACLPCWLRARRTLCSRTTQSDEQRSTSLVSTDTDTCINCDNQLSPNEIMHRLSSEDENLVRIIRLWTYPREVSKVFIMYRSLHSIKQSRFLCCPYVPMYA